MPIKYIKTISEEVAASLVAEDLNRMLATGKRVLWLIPGGSAAKIACLVSKSLTNTSALTISLTDERYGEPNHPESNFHLIKELGFSTGEARVYEVLRGLNFEETVRQYNDFFNNLEINYDYTVALLGMGPDGHTSGVLPNSAAVVSDANVCGYIANDYNRITTTPKLLNSLDKLFVYAVGKPKHIQIQRLNEDIKIQEQPIQLIKQAKDTVFINDLEGNSV